MASRRNSPRQKSRIAARAAGASAGSILVYIANLMPESKWKQFAVFAAPTISVAISDTVSWLGAVWAANRATHRAEHKRKADELQAEQNYITAKKTLEDVIKDSKASDQRKEECRRDLEDLERFRTNSKLALVYKHDDTAESVKA